MPFSRKNQPKALQAEGRNFLTIVYDSTSLTGECKDTREVHLVVVKEKIESIDLIWAQIQMEVQTLFEEFDDVIPQDLLTWLPPMRNIQTSYR